jgi:hypothetical protein
VSFSHYKKLFYEGAFFVSNFLITSVLTLDILKILFAGEGICERIDSACKRVLVVRAYVLRRCVASVKPLVSSAPGAATGPRLALH